MNESHEWIGTERDGTAYLRCAKCDLTLAYTLACTNWQRPTAPPTPEAGAARKQADYEIELGRIIITALAEVDKQLSLAIFGADEIKQLDLMLELTMMRAQLDEIRNRPRLTKGVIS